MSGQPLLGSFNQVENGFVGGFAFQLGVTGFFSYPGDGIGAVGINGQGRFVGRLQGQGMDKGQEFADVVGAVFEWPLMKNDVAGAGKDTSVLQTSGVATAGGIYGQEIARWLVKVAIGRIGVVSGGFPTSVQGLSSGFFRFVTLVFGPFKAFYLGLAGIPCGVNAGLTASPHHVVFPGLSHGLFGTFAVGYVIVASTGKDVKPTEFTFKGAVQHRYPG